MGGGGGAPAQSTALTEQFGNQNKAFNDYLMGGMAPAQGRANDVFNNAMGGYQGILGGGAEGSGLTDRQQLSTLGGMSNLRTDVPGELQLYFKSLLGNQGQLGDFLSPQRQGPQQPQGPGGFERGMGMVGKFAPAIISAFQKGPQAQGPVMEPGYNTPQESMATNFFQQQQQQRPIDYNNPQSYMYFGGE